MTRITLITHEDEHNHSFAHSLEERAGETIRQRVPGSWDSGDPSLMIVREIALTLDHLDKVRKLHEHLARGLLRLECYIDTEIIQREPRPPVYEDPRLRERDMLRGRLLQIEQERRRLAIIRDEKLQALHDRLLTLMNKHVYLGA